MIRVLIADDHPIVREGFGAIVNAEPDIEVVAQASNGIEALEHAAATNPSVALMDLRMPRMGGVEAIRQLRQTNPNLRPSSSPPTTTTTPSTRPSEPAPAAISSRTSAPKTSYAPSAPSTPAARCYNPWSSNASWTASAPTTPADETPPFEALTPREVEVLQIMARGARNRDIAQELVISERTVKIHVANIIAKLAVTNRTAAVVRAIDLNLIQNRGS